MNLGFIQSDRFAQASGRCAPVALQRADETAAVYAVGRAGDPEAHRSNPFRDTTDVTLPRRGCPPGLDVFAASVGRVTRYFDDATDTAVYLVGRGTHLKFRGEALAR